jgi:1-acyl-sn-glycerol-3-phosphate acyltransferase
LDLRVEGVENFPDQGPALIVGNHLGDADVIVGMAIAPFMPDALAKAELYDYPIVGRMMDRYGVIWVHRGQPDRRALRAANEGLAEGRMLSMAPEGRQSVTGSLEAGTDGAAYIALKADVPIVPVGLAGSEDSNVYGSMKRLRRARVVAKVGPPFRLDSSGRRKEAISRGTVRIMHALAELLPEEYQGIYRSHVR